MPKTRKLSKQQANMTWKALFEGSALKVRQVFKFKRSKKLWFVYWETSKGYYVSTINRSSKQEFQYIYPRDFHRIEIISGEKLLRFLLRKADPADIDYYFPNEKERMKLLRKIVPK